MADVLFDHLDFEGKAAIRATFDPRTTDPAQPWYVGQVWTRTDTGRLRMATGAAAFVEFRVSADLITAADLAGGIPLSKLATDPLARANHTGTQLAATISDFAAAALAANSSAISTASAADRNRANHTGTQLAATISDLAATVKAYKLSDFAAPTTAVAMANQKITGLADPALPGDAATKGYVDSAIQGLSPKAPVRYSTGPGQGAYSWSGATYNAGVLTAGTNGTLQDLTGGATYWANLAPLDRVLVPSANSDVANGIYVVTSVGSASSKVTLVRATDADSYAELVSAYVWVEADDTGWVCTADPGGTLGTTPLPWVKFTGAGAITAGNGLLKTGDTLDVGAGYGLQVDADTVAIQQALVARKYPATITGDGSKTSFQFALPGLVADAATAPSVSVKRISDGAIGRVGVVIGTFGTQTLVTVTFGAAPAAGQQYAVTIFY